MRWSAQSLTEACGGELRVPGERPAEETISGLSIDSRTLNPGDLFVAIRADRDGHDFVDAAIEAGAGGVLVERGRPDPVSLTVARIEVSDTSRALLAIGSAARERLDARPVVGITGSVGKTSTKDLAAAALSSRLAVAASVRSFNNDLGVPLTLANAPDATEVAVIEMGSRGSGHLTRLSEVVRPTVAVVTAVSAAHTDAFGDLDGVASAKFELVAALPDDGTVVLNADDPRVAAMAGRAGRSVTVLTCSAAGLAGADVVAEEMALDEELRPSFAVRSPWGDSDVRLEARGAHQVGNALLAIAVAGCCGVEPAAAAEALRGARLSPWRMEVRRTRSGAVVINDSYNANPASMAAALDALASLPARRRIAVLGDMAELGAMSKEEHLGVARLARKLGIELVAVGTDAYGTEPAPGAEEALAAIRSQGGLGEGDAVLVKASRVAGLEGLAEHLLTD